MEATREPGGDGHPGSRACNASGMPTQLHTDQSKNENNLSSHLQRMKARYGGRNATVRRVTMLPHLPRPTHGQRWSARCDLSRTPGIPSREVPTRVELVVVPATTFAANASRIVLLRCVRNLHQLSQLASPDGLARAGAHHLRLRGAAGVVRTLAAKRDSRNVTASAGVETGDACVRTACVPEISNTWCMARPAPDLQAGGRQSDGARPDRHQR